MASQLLTAHKQRISNLTLVPSGGGCFELKADGELVYSKLATGEFPNESQMVDEIGARLN